MLEAIRNHAQGWIAKIILGLLILSFAIWGVESYVSGGGKETAVATVGGIDITEREFAEALSNQREAMGGQVDVDNPGLRKEVLDQLINTTLLGLAAGKAGMRVSDTQIEAALREIPVFQDNGVFSESRLEGWLRNRGMSRARLVELLRQDILLNKMQFAYGEGALLGPATVRRMAALLAEKREVSELFFPSRAQRDGVVIDDAAVKADYEANRANFATPEQVRVQYLALSVDSLLARIDIPEASARQHYEANAARYQEPEQRRASHILIRTAEGRDAARAKAKQILNEARANPARFADLARQHSQDPGSAQNGGSLGSFVRETMVKPFADAVFSMQVGGISDLVETEFGFHIIRLEGITPGARLGFEVVRHEIVEELRQQEAHRRFAEAAERFNNLVYEQPESLQPASQEFGLPLQESGWISREHAEPAMLAKPRLVEALFSPEALEKKHNTEAIEVNPGMLVAARVLEHKRAGVRPLAEVSDVIRAKLIEREALARAVAAGKAALKAARAGQEPAGWAAPAAVSRMQPAALPPAAIKAIFKSPVTSLPAYVGVEMPDGYRLYRLARVTPGEVAEAQLPFIQRDILRLTAQEELRAFLEFHRTQAKVKINTARAEKRD